VECLFFIPPFFSSVLSCLQLDKFSSVVGDFPQTFFRSPILSWPGGEKKLPQWVSPAFVVFCAFLFYSRWFPSLTGLESFFWRPPPSGLRFLHSFISWCASLELDVSSLREGGLFSVFLDFSSRYVRVASVISAGVTCDFRCCVLETLWRSFCVERLSGTMLVSGGWSCVF